MSKKERLPGFAWILAVTFIGLPLVRIGVGYLPFHYLVENMTILVGLLLYVLAFKTYKFARNSTILFIGITYFYASVLGILHTMTYKGMNLIPGISSDFPTQYWIARRFMETIGVLLAISLGKKEISPFRLHVSFGIATSLIIAAISLGIFPSCYIDGSGLTPFKKVSEYLILAISVVTLWKLKREGRKLGSSYAKSLARAILVGMTAEFCFTLYLNVYDVFNVAGHVLYFASSGLIAVFVVNEGLERPYTSIFEDLYQRSIRDPLTGLFNRHGLGEMAGKIFERSARIPSGFTLLFMDIDNFKRVNDLYGHPEGDLALNEFGNILRAAFREYAIIARVGGDEFVVLVEDLDAPVADNPPESRLMAAVESWTTGNNRRSFLGLTIGRAYRAKGEGKSLEELIAVADAEVLKRKGSKIAGSTDGSS